MKADKYLRNEVLSQRWNNPKGTLTRKLSPAVLIGNFSAWVALSPVVVMGSFLITESLLAIIPATLFVFAGGSLPFIFNTADESQNPLLAKVIKAVPGSKSYAHSDLEDLERAFYTIEAPYHDRILHADRISKAERNKGMRRPVSSLAFGVNPSVTLSASEIRDIRAPYRQN